MLSKLLRQSSSAGGEWVDCIVDGHLAILVQKLVNLFAAFLEDLLPKENRGRGG